MADVLVTGIKIGDMPLKGTVSGNEKLPTGDVGDLAVTPNQIKDFTIAEGNLVSQEQLDDAVESLEQTSSGIAGRVQTLEDRTSNVNNTADLDKPVSNATQAALNEKADKVDVDAKLDLKADKDKVVSSFNGQTGAVTLDQSDLIDVGGDFTAIPTFQNVPKLTKPDGSSIPEIDSQIQPLVNSIAVHRQGLTPTFDQAFADAIGGYPLNARLMLSNGDIVQSTIANNANDPNVVMTGWVKKGDLIEVESVAEMLAVSNTYDGMSIATKSYHAGLNKGACSYYYDSSRIAENNGGSVINGWVAIDIISDVTQWGAKGDGVSDDTVAFQNAVNNVDKLYVPEGIYLCNVILNTAFNIQGSGKSTVLKPFDISKPVLTNINRVDPSWTNDSVSDLELRSTGFTGTGFQYGVLPANNDYYGVGRVVMNNVRIIGFEHGVRKVNGNIGNKYYNCNFEYNKYGVYATSNQVAIPGSTFIMHSGCDMYYSCNFSENTVAGVAYYDNTHGSGQWLFDHCTFQFNSGFGLFFDFDIPSTLFSPIVLHNSWFEENGGNQVVIDRYNGNSETLMSVPKKVFGSNDIIVIGGENYNTRMGIGTLNPQRALHVHGASASIIQLTTGYTGDVDPNRGALVFFTYPDAIIENKEGGRILLRTPYGDAEIDIDGNLVSRKAKIGYGKGAGNVVTQGGNKDWAVTCNTPSGRIITSAQSLAAGANISFILNNSYIEETDVLIANVRYSPSNNARYYDVKVINVNNGTCIINIKNIHNIALAEEIHISFCIVKGAVDPVY